MRPMPWLIALVVAGAAALAAMLMIPEQGPTEVDRPEADFGGPPVSTSGTAIAAVRGIGGREDLSELIGDQVEVVVDIGQAVNDVAFWVGTPPDDLLVVMDRGTRTGVERQLGLPSQHFFRPPPHALVTVRGVVEPVPYPEAMYSWGLTRRDVTVLQERGVYVRAYEVVSAEPYRTEPPPAEAVDELGRETAPPPGEEVQTPLDLPPPPP